MKELNGFIKDHATLGVMPGIGDIAWVFMKIQNAIKNFDVEVAFSNTPRSLPFVNVIQGIESSMYGGFRIRDVAKNNIDDKTKRFKDVFYISCNHWLEAGNRIEDWLPSLDTSYKLDFDLDPTEVFLANEKLKGVELPIALYTSTKDGNKTWGSFTKKQWFRQVKKINKALPNSKIFIIGADFDREFTHYIASRCSKERIPYCDTTGASISHTITLLKSVNSLISFPSGIGVLGSLLKTPTLMLMPDHLKKMEYTWVDKRLIESKKFVHLQLDMKERMIPTFLNELNRD